MSENKHRDIRKSSIISTTTNLAIANTPFIIIIIIGFFFFVFYFALSEIPRKFNWNCDDPFNFRSI